MRRNRLVSFFVTLFTATSIFAAATMAEGGFAARVAPLRRLSGAVPVARKSLDKLWALRQEAPEGHRETFKEAVAAGWLSIEDRTNYEKIRSELRNPAALEKETSTECSACLGTGESKGQACFRCKGAGRISDWKKAKKVYEEKLDSIPGLGPKRGAPGGVLGAETAARLRSETNNVAATGATANPNGVPELDAGRIEALFQGLPQRLLRADCVRDANGKPAVFVGEDSRQASVSVRLSVDGTAYQRFVRDTAAHLPSMSRRTAKANVPGFKGGAFRDFLMDEGGFRFFFLFPSMKESDYNGWIQGRTLFVVSNPLTMSGTWYLLDDAHFTEIEKYLCRASETSAEETIPSRPLKIGCVLVGENDTIVHSSEYEFPQESWVLTARMPESVVKKGAGHLAVTPFLSIDAFVPGWGMLGGERASGVQFVGAAPERDYRFAPGTGFMRMDDFDVLLDLPLSGATPEQLLATVDVKIVVR